MTDIEAVRKGLNTIRTPANREEIDAAVSALSELESLRFFVRSAVVRGGSDHWTHQMATDLGAATIAEIRQWMADAKARLHVALDECADNARAGNEARALAARGEEG
jgi:hypothetical protein